MWKWRTTTRDRDRYRQKEKLHSFYHLIDISHLSLHPNWEIELFLLSRHILEFRNAINSEYVLNNNNRLNIQFSIFTREKRSKMLLPKMPKLAIFSKLLLTKYKMPFIVLTFSVLKEAMCENEKGRERKGERSVFYKT